MLDYVRQFDDNQTLTIINNSTIKKGTLNECLDLVDYGCMSDYVLDSFCHLLKKYNETFNPSTTIKVKVKLHFFHAPFLRDHEWDSQKNKIFVHF